MATPLQKKRRRLIQSAEGYLDLAMMFEDRWSLRASLRRILADRAIGCLNEITNPMGHKPYILFLKGQAHRVAERFHEAARLFEQFHKLDPDDLSGLLALGWCYKRTERLNQAIAALQKAVSVDAASAISHYNLACYCALANRVDDAVTHLAIALDLDEDYRDLVKFEHDFDLIRQLPDFRSIFEINA